MEKNIQIKDYQLEDLKEISAESMQPLVKVKRKRTLTVFVCVVLWPHVVIALVINAMSYRGLPAEVRWATDLVKSDAFKGH